MNSKRFNILVIDDEMNIRLGAERILQGEGFVVLTAESGEKGLEILERQSVHILLLDLMMPGIGGMEVLRHVSVTHPGLLVIVITGHATLETAIEAMKQGAYDFIPKPFKPDQLRIVVFRATETLRLREEHRRLEEERQHNLRAIEREKNRTRTIVRSMSEGVLLTDREGDVILCNPAAQSMLGFPRDSCEGVPMIQDIPEEALRAQLEEILAEGGAGGAPRQRDIELPDGRWLLSTVRPIATEEDNEGSVLTVLSDITTQKNLAQLKSEFVAKVSHDLRSPLAAINQQLAVLAMDLEGEEHKEHRHRLSRVRERVRGLLSLIADLLDISRIELGMTTGTSEVFDPQIVLECALEEVAHLVEARRIVLSVRACKASRPVEMVGDPRDLESVFVNLLTNALKYTDEGGRVSVEVETNDTRLTVTVVDTGHGIAESDLPHIFDKFYRVNSDKTRMVLGTGLGLPIVKGIVTAMGGGIDVSSELDKGSRFTITLPLQRKG